MVNPVCGGYERLTDGQSDFLKQILYINIGINSETFFNWRNPSANLTFNQIDVLASRNYPGNLSYYIHLKKSDYKLVFRKIAPRSGRGKTCVFIIGGTLDCQYQVLEAFIEYLSEHWYTLYEDVFLQTSSFGQQFDGFKEIVKDAFQEVPKNYLINVSTKCQACASNFYVYVRKSIIDNAQSFPVALVFEHADHALLLYIDQQGKSRGESSVDITG